MEPDDSSSQEFLETPSEVVVKGLAEKKIEKLERTLEGMRVREHSLFFILVGMGFLQLGTDRKSVV